MRRWLPHPLMSVFVLGTWLVLNQSLAPGHLLLGAVFGLALGAFFERLNPPRLGVRRFGLLIRLIGRVTVDIVRSNFTVLWIVLRPGTRNITSGFVEVPLKLKDPYALAVLACIITSTPGTIWVSYEPQDGLLLIHVFDLVDEAVWIRTVTERYENPLREIFE